jgi:acyl-CoA dehydrogenase
MTLGFAEACIDEALAWSRQRQTFGAALIDRQAIRHKLMDSKCASLQPGLGSMP